MGANSPAVGDLGGGPGIDVAFVDYAAGVAQVFAFDFEPGGTATLTTHTGPGPTLEYVAAGNLNDDGTDDLIASAGPQGILLPMFGPLSSDSFGPQLNISGNPGRVRVADLDCDGHDDVVVALRDALPDDTSDIAMIARGPGPRFANPVRYQVPTNPVDLDVADIDGDGAPDVAVISANPPQGWLTIVHAVGLR